MTNLTQAARELLAWASEDDPSMPSRQAEASVRLRSFMPTLRELVNRNEKMEGLLREFANCGVEHDAGKYLVAQVDRAAMKEAKELTQ